MTKLRFYLILHVFGSLAGVTRLHTRKYVSGILRLTQCGISNKLTTRENLNETSRRDTTGQRLSRNERRILSVSHLTSVDALFLLIASIKKSDFSASWVNRAVDCHKNKSRVSRSS